jgi:predicted O-methyltransferase YrrM
VPPVSGSAQDEARIKERNLKAPIIEERVAESKLDMWQRKDIQVNPVLAEAYRVGFFIDDTGEKQKMKDTTNPIQGRNLYNLIKDNKFSRTLEVGFAMGASAVWMMQAHKGMKR